jgi:hypothetical protein
MAAAGRRRYRCQEKFEQFAAQGGTGEDVMSFSTLLPKTEKSFSAFSERQPGQQTFSFSSLERKRTSKTFPHFLHLNS